MKYYRINSKSIVFYPPDSWYTEFKKDYMCPGYGCYNFHKNILNQKVGADIVVEEKLNKAAMIPVHPGFQVIRKDFLDLFMPEAEDLFYFGAVELEGGKVLDSHVTLIGKKRLPLRGPSKTTFYGICEKCGRYRYHPKYPWYVMEQALTGQAIYESYGLGGLIVNEVLRQRVDKSKWKGIEITELSVELEPKDGIDEMPVDLLV